MEAYGDISQLPTILQILKDQEADDTAKIAALSTLCEISAMASEEFYCDDFIPILVEFIRQGSPELKLLATRSITYICDAFPWHCSEFVFEGAVPILCEHLIIVDYLDLAEESVLALEKISQKRASCCLRDGAFTALLLNLDFFSRAIKKHALSAAANISLKLLPSTIGLAMKEIPVFLGVLSDPDAQMVGHACVCLSQIAGAAATSLDSLEELSKYGLVAKAISLISVTNSLSSQASLSSPRFTALIGLLSKCASASAVLSGEMIEMGISRILRDILSASDIISQMPISLSPNKPTNQLYEIVSFTNELLPSVSYEKISLPTSDESGHTRNSTREKLFQEKPELLVEFGMNLFPLMIQVYGSILNAQVSCQCLEIIKKLLYLGTPEMLKHLLQEINISRFLAGILCGKDFEISLAALKMAEILIQKLPDMIFDMFMREGVFHAVGTLISTGSTVSGEDETHTTRNISSESEGSRIEEIVNDHARQFKATYFDSNPRNRASNSFCKLTNLCKKLDGTLCDLNSKSIKGKRSRVVHDSYYGFNGKIEGNPKQENGKSKGKGKSNCAVSDNNKLPSIMADILSELCHNDGISTFEFVKSGVVTSLINYFAGRDLKKDKMSKADSIGHQLEIIKRLETFVDLSLPLTVHGKETPLTILVRKLQDALLSEDFPTQSGQCLSSRNNNPIKVRLCRAQGEKALSSLAPNTLYIEALARITDIEDYLSRRLQISESEINCTTSVAKPGTQVTSIEASAEVRSSARFRSSTTVDNSANSTLSKEGECTIGLNGMQVRSGTLMRDALETEQLQIQQQGGFSDEGLLEEPASISVMEGANDIFLRDPVNASGIDDFRTIKARANSSEGFSRSRDHPTFNFFIGGKLLDRSSTIYEAIQKNKEVEGDETSDSGSECMYDSIWYKVHKIRYKKVNSPGRRNLTETNKEHPRMIKFKNFPCIDKILQGKLPYDIQIRDTTHDILLLLKFLNELNKLAPCLRANSLSDAFAKERLKSLDELKANGPTVPQEEFLNGKLTPKLAHYLQDAETLASSSLPNWCHQLTENCPFLFPFEIRRQYFMFTALHKISPHPHLRNNDAARPPRLKVCVSRKHVLEAATQVMNLCRGQKGTLEIQYYNEVGSGLGPTLEFYTLISHELQRSKIRLWRTNAGESGQASQGLFPRPYPPHTDSCGGRENINVIENFTLIGFLMAKALQDGRFLDLPLSRAFYKLLLGKDLDLYDIKYFDIELGTTLQEMQALAARRQYLESMSANKSKEILSLHYRGAKIEDLCIDFTLPGFPHYPLKPGGSSILVTIDNIDDYVSLAVDATIGPGIRPQIEALRKGFNQVFPISNLEVFSEKELETLLCGERNLWEAEMLRDHIKFDHGYTAQCHSALDFLEITAQFTPKLQRAFLQFVTGCPNLPPGGLSSLNPKLTVVRKNPPNSTEAVDMDLPSAMTCTNYLKLPPYSNKKTMRDRLVYAITEGQGSFDLS